MPHDEDYGPQGDPARHLGLAELESGLRALPPPPKDTGTVALLVVRRADGMRETPERVQLGPDSGLPGDRWARLTPDHPEAQLTVMRRDVGELIANGQPLTLFGDNLVVDLDLSDESTPPGSRLRVGGAVVEVTPKPHTGCSKYAARFGAQALRFISQKTLRGAHLRGVYWKVVEAGPVAVGDGIRVLSRG